MDGRWKLYVAGGVILCGGIGCTTTKPEAPPPPPPATAKNTVYVPEPADDGNIKDGPLACSTLILFANTWVDAVAKDPNKSAAERDQLLSRARRAYQEVMQREPKNVDAWLGMGQMYQVTGELQKLQEIEQKVTAMYPRDAKVWAWVAVRQAQAKNWDAATASYQKAVDLDPDNRMYRIHLGFTLARARHYAEGYDCLSRSMREGEARYNLAQMMIHNGDVDKARMELRLCLKADPNLKGAEQLLASLANGAPQTNRDLR